MKPQPLSRVLRSTGICGVLALLFSGCLGPLPAVPDGSVKHPRVVLAVRPAASGREAETLLEDQTDLTASMPLTPEGSVRKMPVVFIHRYYLQRGSGEPRPLEFLGQSALLDSKAGLQAAFPVADDEWVAIQHHEQKSHPENRLELPHHFAIGSFTVIRFTPQGIVSQRDLAAADGGARFSLRPGARTLRFWRNDGWWWFDLRNGAEQPEPNRIAEVAPGPHGITLPGTSLRIAFDLPEFSAPDVRLRSSPTISLHDEGYSFNVVIGAQDRNLFGADGLEFALFYGKDHQGGTTPTMAEILRGYAHLNPILLPSGQFYRMEESLRAPPNSGFPARKVVHYVADLHGTPLVIQVVVPTPSEHWAKALVRFEAALRVEDGGDR